MADKFLGIPYPLTKSPLGYFRPQGGVEQIKSDMLILLLTNPGERVMLPEYGTGLRDLIFEPNDADLRARARQLIIKAIKDWEPRVSVEQIEVLTSIDETSLSRMDDRSETDAILMIRILFKDPQDISTVHELKLDVPLGGSNT